MCSWSSPRRDDREDQALPNVSRIAFATARPSSELSEPESLIHGCSERGPAACLISTSSRA